MKANDLAPRGHRHTLSQIVEKTASKSDEKVDAPSDAHLKAGCIELFKSLMEAEKRRAKDPGNGCQAAFFGYPIERLRRDYPEIDFMMPYINYPKRRGQMIRSLIAWYRWLRDGAEIETICKAGQWAAVMAGARFVDPLSPGDLESIRNALKLKAKLDDESIMRVLTDTEYLFKPRSLHIFMFDTLQRYFPNWSTSQLCELADQACLCKATESHDLRTMQKLRRERRQAITHRVKFKLNPPEFVRRFMEHEERCRRESEALASTRIRNPKIRAATSDKKEFLREKKRGWKLEEKVMVGNGAIWLLSPPD